MPTPMPNIPEPHLHLVYAAALRQTRDPHVAADITQAVFLLLARRIQQGRPPRENHMAGWLLNVTRFAVKESRRAATRRAHHEKKSAALREEQAPATEDSLLPHLDAALLSLPATDRELLIRRYLQSQPVNELAATLNIPPNTAAKRITRALDRLRNFLQNRGITAPAALLTATLTTQSLIHTPPAVAAQILAAPAHMTPLAKSLLFKLLLLKLQTALAIAAALILTCAGAFLVQHHLHNATSPVATAPPIQSPPSATARGLSTATDPQTEHTRALLFKLRYSVITTATTEETYAAIRDLVSISKPAVPELCAELDRATSDSELRALTFTLRAINDPRAVPALIRALPKTPVLVSDFGDRIDDPALWQFVTDHRLPGTTPETFPAIDIPRANREITVALEKFANATIAKAGLGGARNSQPGSIARAQALRQQDADRWQEWWDNHYQQFLPQKDPLPITTPDPAQDPIESAGIAAFGPLFPTGPHVRLGPIHDLILPPQGLYDVPAFLNLESGRAFTIWENASDTDETADSLFPWLKSAGIDVAGAASWRRPRKIGNTNGITTDYPDDLFYSLNPFSTRTWPVEIDRWDSFESDTHNPAPLDLGKWGPTGNLIPRNLDTGDLIPLRLPATFLFITSHHARGILQLLDSSNTPPGIHFRYRLLETPAATTSPQSPPSLTARADVPAHLHFAPEKTITLHSPTSSDPAALHLDTGESHPADPAALNLNDPTRLFTQVDAWLATWHGDLIVQPRSPTDENLFALRCSDMAAFPCTTAAFQNLSPAKTAAIAACPPRSSPTFITPDAEQQSPATWAFKTRSGATGLLQITGSTPTTLTLRYKLLATTP